MCETGNYSRAAELLSLSQPAVSKQVKLLEEQLGLTLFERGSGGLMLTEQGQLMYDFFTKHLTELEEVTEKAANIQSRRKDVIRIGCLDGWNTDTFYPELQNVIKRRYPNAQLSLTAKNHVDMTDALLDSEIDIGLTHESAITLHSGLKSCVISSSYSIFVISAQNPLAAKGSRLPAAARGYFADTRCL